MVDSVAVGPTALRLIYLCDRARFALFRRRRRGALHAHAPVSPNLRLARIWIAPGGRLEVGAGFATERQRGNHVRVYPGGTVRLGPDVWLRTACGENRITAFDDATIEVGAEALINGAMLHAKSAIRIGREARLAFGVRVLDADLHDLDCETPERTAPIQIGDRVWLGADVLVLRGVTIGDDVVVAAGSIVTRDLPSNCLAIGTPAKPVRTIASRVGCS